MPNVGHTGGKLDDDKYERTWLACWECGSEEHMPNAMHGGGETARRGMRTHPAVHYPLVLHAYLWSTGRFTRGRVTCVCTRVCIRENALRKSSALARTGNTREPDGMHTRMYIYTRPDCACSAPGLSDPAPGLSHSAPGLSDSAPGLSDPAPGLSDSATGLRR